MVTILQHQRFKSNEVINSKQQNMSILSNQNKINMQQ